ncbi:MAG: formate dehydrogenase subunit alpha [Syntrophomonadaceae bacterium]|nr:formate dehydrogenase subunit alpha [Syntrophomonadaceae bacterium]
MELIKLIINGKEAEAPAGSTVLQAAEKAGIDIPRLCYDPELSPLGACRLCVVEVEGNRLLPAACVTPVMQGMVVNTESPAVVEARKTILELLIANHPLECMTCDKLGDCKLAEYAYRYGIKESPFEGEKHEYAIDDDNPFIIRDLNKCILCGACVRACEEMTGKDNLSYLNRGFNRKATTAGDVSYLESDCVFCGQCVAVCPTGALTEKTMAGKARRWEIERVQTTCPFCGTGCNFDLAVKDKKVIGVLSNPDAPVNGRRLCVKGRFGWDYIYSDKRLQEPLIKKNGKFEPASWEEAFNLIAQKFNENKAKNGPDSFAALSSARCNNEASYLVQKFTRAHLGTNNVDHCARVCHAPSVAGLANSFGSGAMTNVFSEVTNDAQLLFLIGINPTEAYPVAGYIMRQAVRNGCKLVVCDPRRTELAAEADIWLQQKHGTDIPLLNGLMHIIIKEGLEDKKFIEECTENYEEMKKVAAEYTPERVSEITGVAVEDLYRVARLYATTDRAMAFYSLGITEHICGTRNVMSIANLAMLTGHLGRPGVGVCPIRGQNNVQGACDMGALPICYSGYQSVTDQAAREKMEKAWGATLPDKVGLKIPEMFDAAVQGKIKVMYILGENPVLTDSNANHVKKALESLDFLVVQELFLTETAEFADVVLPGASFAESDGTFTNTERRPQRIRQAIEPLPGQTDCETICQMSTAMGYPMSYNSAADIWAEMASLTPSMAGISYERLEKESVHWPCTSPDHPGTPILHIGKFTRGLGGFQPNQHIPPGEMPDEDYPILLCTGRVMQHYNVTTQYSPGLKSVWPIEMTEVHPQEAARLGLVTGSKFRVTSRRGSVVTNAWVTDRVQPGVIWMSHHHSETPTNELTSHHVCDIAGTYEYKVCAVNIEKVQEVNG